MSQPVAIRKLLQRIVIGLVVAICGVLAVVALFERQRALSHAREELQGLARSVGASQSEWIESARHTLQAIASAPAVREGDLDRCNNYLASLLTLNQDYANIGLISLDGQLGCRALPMAGSGYLGDRLHFQRALATGGLAVGDFIIEKATQIPSLSFALPLSDVSGQPRGVVFVAMKLSRINRQLQALVLPYQAEVSLVDGGGNILTSSRDGAARAGQPVPVLALRDAIAAHRHKPDGVSRARQQGQPGQEGKDDSGQAVLYALQALQGGASDELFVVLSASREAALTEYLKRLRWEAAAMLLLALAAGALIWGVGNRRMAQPAARLLSRMQQLAGEPGPPMAVGDAGGDEFRQLEAGFENMRLRLQHREHDLQTLVVALQAESQKQQLAQDLAGIGFFEFDVEQWSYRSSERIYEMLGLSPDNGPISHEIYEMLVHPEDRLALAAERLATWRADRLMVATYRIVRPDGQTRWIEARSKIERVKGDVLLGLSGVLQDVTERKLADAELQKQQALRRIVGRTARIGGWTINLPDMHVDCTDEINSMLELPAGVPSLDMAVQWFEPASRERAQAALTACLTEGRPIDLEASIAASTGRLLRVRIVAEARRNDQGTIEAVQGAIQDVTEFSQAQATLQQSAERFRLLASATRDVIRDWNLSDGSGWWSAGFQELFGQAAPDAAAGDCFRAWTAQLHPADRDPVADSLRAAIASQAAAWSAEYRMRTGDGGWLEVLDRCHLIRDGSGRAVRLVGGITDLSAIRIAERATRGQLARVKLLNEITLAISSGFDLTRIFTVVGSAVEQHLGVPICAMALFDDGGERATLSGFGEAGAALAPDLGLTLHLVLPASTSGLARCLGGELVYDAVLKGSPFELGQRLASANLGSLVLAPMQAEARVLGVLIVGNHAEQGFGAEERHFLRQLSRHVALAVSQARLLSDLQRSNEDLRQTQVAVLQQERLRALSEMASGIAHDINNAISPILLYTEALLEGEPGLSARARGFLQTMQSGIDDVSRTVSRMREFYRPARQQGPLERLQLNNLIAPVLALTRSRWRDLAQQRGIAIEVLSELELDLPEVLGVDGDLRDMLAQLIFNAVDALPEGGRITLRTRRRRIPGTQRDGVCLEVIDDGVGMDDATRQHCLDPFFSTKGERGTGLGLSMVYGAIKRHQAQIEIDSAPGQGSTLRLLFEAAATGAAAPADAVPAAATPSAIAAPLSLLLIDDDAPVAASLAEILRSDGHQVTVADGGSAGIALFKAALQTASTFHAVVTDLGMPDIDGRAVALAIKALSPHTPVVMLTGWGRRMRDEGDMPEGVDLLLGKPPKLAELRDMAARLRQTSGVPGTAGKSA